MATRIDPPGGENGSVVVTRPVFWNAAAGLDGSIAMDCPAAAWISAATPYISVPALAGPVAPVVTACPAVVAAAARNAAYAVRVTPSPLFCRNVVCASWVNLVPAPYSSDPTTSDPDETGVSVSSGVASASSCTVAPACVLAASWTWNEFQSGVPSDSRGSTSPLSGQFCPSDHHAHQLGTCAPPPGPGRVSCASTAYGGVRVNPVAVGEFDGLVLISAPYG